MIDGPWQCLLCDKQAEGKQSALAHETWHMDFLIADGSETAFDIMEAPMFQPLKISDDR